MCSMTVAVHVRERGGLAARIEREVAGAGTRGRWRGVAAHRFVPTDEAVVQTRGEVDGA